MTHPDILVLLAVRLRSRAPSELVQVTDALLGGDPATFDRRLAAAGALDQVRTRGEEERRSLTGAGEAELAAHLGAETDVVGRADLTTAYEAFLPLNRAFLAAVQAEDVPVEALREMVDDLEPVLEVLTTALPRFRSYRARFDTALGLAEMDPDWIASPTRDSVHTIWFELHEHLLATLGRDRTGER
ncbi:MAG: hypothetical protein R8F63_10965 [Acidimicrobiales bacterium]|nr:hypothetical protein [Acidimicrobiales bacterium]